MAMAVQPCTPGAPNTNPNFPLGMRGGGVEEREKMCVRIRGATPELCRKADAKGFCERGASSKLLKEENGTLRLLSHEWYWL